MSDLRIVAADNIKGSGLDKLKAYFGDGLEVRGKFSPEELLQEIPSIDVLLIRSGTTVPREAIEKAERLKIIGRAGVGTDNIDKEAATEAGIIVMNTPLGNTISAAEQAIALIFACARNTARADRLMQEHNWAKKELGGVEVYGKTLGLLGLGKIGGHVAKVLRAAGMKVLAHDPFLSEERAKQLGVDLVDLDELLARSDFMSLHTPLTDKTRNLLDRDRLLKAKKGLRIVNCARGGIIDETALAELVQEGHIAGAALDVYATEPTTEGPLFGVKNILLTPHLGASTEEAEERCGSDMAEQVIAYFEKGAIINAVNIDIVTDPSLKGFVDTARCLGAIGATLLNAAPESIEVACAGKELDSKDTGEITAAAVLGLLKTFGLDDANLVNARYFAQRRGITVGQAAGCASGVYINSIRVTLRGGGKECTVAGTAVGGVQPRLIRIDDADMDMRLTDHLLFLRYPDQPGYVGTFGTLIAKYDINIANMEVGSLESLQRASMAIGLDSAAPEALLEELRAVEGVERAYSVSL